MLTHENGFHFEEIFVFTFFEKSNDNTVVFSLHRHENRKDFEENVNNFPSALSLYKLLGTGYHSVLDVLRNLQKTD